MEIHVKLQPQSLKRLLFRVLIFEVVLAVLFALSKLPNMPLTLVELFDFDREAALPAWFSAAQLSLIGLTCLLWAFWSEQRALVPRRLLLLLGVIFVFLSADEAAMIHERLTPMFKSVRWLPRFSGDRGLWIPLYLASMGLFLIKFRRDFWQMWRTFPQQIKLCCLGGGIFLFGAVGLEVLNYELLSGPLASHWPITLQILFEELFEMAGASLILYGFISMAFTALDVSRSPDAAPLPDHHLDAVPPAPNQLKP